MTRGPRGVFDVNLLKDWGPGVTQKMARDHAWKFEGCSWRADGCKSGSCDYRCLTHVDCPRKIRLVYKGGKDSDLGARLFSNGKGAFRHPPP